MSTNQTSSSSRIVRNTLFLYFRMFITILVGLYTSRVVLQTLGESDFGTYTLVGGLVMMASFLNVGMTQASQRFISYALGQNNHEELRRAFSASLYTHLGIALLIVIVAESAGLWVIDSLNIPTERTWAAAWVYQCSIFTLVTSIISVPYNSTIVAHEHMDFYAYVSIIEVVLKLAIVYLLTWSSFDKLVTYSVLLLGVQLLVRSIYTIYCGRHFQECRERLVPCRTTMFEMFRFAGWSILGNMGFSLRDQGTNIILNKFYGSVIGLSMNAARGIATHISSIINGFSTNVTMALNPPIVKHYAAGRHDESIKLVYAGSRLAFFLLAFITIPFLINAESVLQLWLGEVPENTRLFVFFIMFTSLIYAMSQPVTVAIQATGRIKTFQIWIFSLMIAELLLAAIALWLTHNLIVALIPSLLSNIAALVMRFAIIKRMVPLYSWRTYITQVFIRCWSVFALCYGAVWALHQQLGSGGILHLLGETILYASIVGCFIFTLGLTRAERSFALSKIPFIKRTPRT